jgi:hypothetical protein
MNNQNNTLKNYIPLDKSWINRMGILDLVNGRDQITTFLSKQDDLGGDLTALQRAILSWKKNEPINVGESGTLYRLLKFTSWKLNANKEFVIERTLANRKINDNSAVVNWSQKELLELDNKTSQWASAAALLGDEERLINPPFKLALTYEAIKHWNDKISKDLMWEPRYDHTIQNQAETYIKILNKENLKFEVEQAEDFCFGYVFGFISLEDGERKWPALRGHESDRIIEIKEALDQAKTGTAVTSKDHRVVQAIAMWGKVSGVNVHFQFPESVNKTWPQFWKFIDNEEFTK